MFHFGERDTHIPLSDVDKIRQAYPQGIYHIYPAGHGFNCSERSDYDAASAAVTTPEAAAFFEAMARVSTGGVRVLFSDIEIAQR